MSTPPSRGTPVSRGRSPRVSGADRSHASINGNGTGSGSKVATTFISSRNIPVSNSQTQPQQDTLMSTADNPQFKTPIMENRRPRKSKTDALAAISISSDLAALDLDAGNINSVSVKNSAGSSGAAMAIASVPAKLDLASVKTQSPGHVPPLTNRPFDLQECPVYYPTEEEFIDSMAYIRKISKDAQKFGLCKIVPPSKWKMPFVTDTETFRFKTRVQRLNSIEASSRAKLNFLEALYRYHKQQGNPKVTVPTINNKPLDLWLLRKEVHKLEGYHAVNKAKKWADIGRLLGYKGIPGLSSQLKITYAKVILPYEDFVDGGRKSPTLSTADGAPRTPNHGGKRPDNLVSDPMDIPGSPLSNSSSPLSEPPDDGDHEYHRSRKDSIHEPMDSISNSGSPSKKPTSTSKSHSHDMHKNKSGNEVCEVCHKKDKPTQMLLCDGCDCGFHTFCLTPPLFSVPDGQWFCHTCLYGTGGDFGFDEGEEHSLSSFQARDLAFRRTWFDDHPPVQGSQTLDDPTVSRIGSHLVSEIDVEREFWRLVQSPEETVEIEYGADVHSTTHGSAMPSLETHPLDSYSVDTWNLNNIPILRDSLLRYIKSEISGMTVPWTYVGMIFSTFCWHNEDHYTYSINYMHWGETKTWYGVPGEDAEKFEATIRKEVPDLFETQPDLLFQLVTLLNPGSLTEAGVQVYACNQRAGEFVVTFPKAYHAGFNHGLNFNEAVNFALPDWLPHGRECVERYREHRKSPVFSHDELLITITQLSTSIDTAIWLHENLREMTQRELFLRHQVRELRVREEVYAFDRPEEEYQCFFCKTLCYLSQVCCQCAAKKDKVVCLEHVSKLCATCSPNQKILRLRFSDSFLQEIQQKVSARAAIPGNWQAKFEKLLRESARPQLRSLRALVAEGEKINYPLENLPVLRDCVQHANEWLDTVNGLTKRKQNHKRNKRLRPGQEASEDRSQPSLTDLQKLLERVKNLGFDTPEIALLKNTAAQAEGLQANARELLSRMSKEGNPSTFLDSCSELLKSAADVNVQVEELSDIENIVLQDQLIKELRSLDPASVEPDHLQVLLEKARNCELPEDNEDLRIVQGKLQASHDREERINNLLQRKNKTIAEMDSFLLHRNKVPIDPLVMYKLETVMSKALKFEKQAKAWLMPEIGAALPEVADALQLVEEAEREFDIPAIRDLKRTAEFALDLEKRCNDVLKLQYVHNSEGPIFDTIQKWKEYAQAHLAKFVLPNFNRLSAELELHEQWINKLPWNHAERADGLDVLEDVVRNTRPEDDAPPVDSFYTCICFDPVRPPPPGKTSDAVQCDYCGARFHGVCAKLGGSCPFCDPNHWNGTIHKQRNWHFCYLPSLLSLAPDITKKYADAWKHLDIIVRCTDRLLTVIGQFLSFASQPGNQRPEYIPQVRHYMRKLYKMQFAVSPNPDIAFGLDLAGLHRMIAGRPPPVRMKKRRRPKFIFGQDVDKDWIDGTRCICRGRTPYLQGYPTIACPNCSKLYHEACVFSPPRSDNASFSCPLCCLRRGRSYAYAEVRVTYVGDGSFLEQHNFVDVRSCLENFSREIIYVNMKPPTSQTVYVELVQFVPGQPDSVAVPGPEGNTRPRNYDNNNNNGSSNGRLPPYRDRSSTTPGAGVPPPPPWTHNSLGAGITSPLVAGTKRKQPDGDDSVTAEDEYSRNGTGTPQTTPLRTPGRSPSTSRAQPVDIPPVSPSQKLSLKQPQLSASTGSQDWSLPTNNNEYSSMHTPSGSASPSLSSPQKNPRVKLSARDSNSSDLAEAEPKELIGNSS